MEFKIVQAETDSQIKEIAQMAKILWHDTYDSLLPDGQVDYMIEKFQSEEAVKRQIESENYIYYIVYAQDGTPAAYFGIVPDSRKKGEMLLSKIYIMKESRGMGAAGLVFTFVQEKAKALRQDKLYLTVNKENLHAQKVYEHYGLACEEAVKNDIGSGYYMDDYIMSKTV